MDPRLIAKIVKYFLITSLLILVPSALIWIVLQGYLVTWTGFGEYTKPNTDFVRGKTLWDWMELFIIPIFLSVGLFLLNRSERKNEREIATDRQHEEALQSYLDRMADLLLKEKLLSNENEEVRNVARIRTLTVLRGLDPARKTIVLEFLREAGLIDKERAIVNLSGADLHDAKLYDVDLPNTNLQEVFLETANLTLIGLSGANLQGAMLLLARLEYANLEGANLQEANLDNTNLQHAHLKGANLQGAWLLHADLRYADLEGAHLEGAFLGEANLAGANLQKAYLDNTDLQNVNLKGATMPDGTIHE